MEYDDHRIENLRFLCPNCHAQTDSFSGRNKNNKNTLYTDNANDAVAE